ncbi:MAG: M28 family peptidase [Sphingobacteriales bacterium]|jgi:Zn-dependent M28 family amino/carboxypeptidase
MYRLLLVALMMSASAQAQIKKEAVASFLQAISADSMMGRLPGTAGIDKAASLIAAEFKGAGLPFMTGLKSYYQEFPMVKSEVREATVTVDGEKVEVTDVMVLGEDDQINWKAGDAEKIWIEKGTNLGQKVFGMTGEKGNKIVFADTSNRRALRRFKSFGMQRFGGLGNIVVVLTTKDPSAYDVKVSNNVTRTMFRNVVAMIPGKRSNEYVIFSGHYDHLGTGKAVNGDTIFNGANDDASGTTAVVTLAKYYAKQPKPERTLLFVAFTAEETGGYGATYFSQQLPPEQVIAMFNIEMIGTDSKWGKNTAYITGYDKSDMGALLQENLKGTKFMFHPDPYPDQNLFYRSDNATLARLGVPAHTISTSKMDSEKYYHTVDDEFETLDMDNMTEIIKAIAESSKGIISGKQTPSRVKPLD